MRVVLDCLKGHASKKMLSFILLLTLAGPSVDGAEASGKGSGHRSTLSGDWGGLRSRLQARGVRLDATLVGELWDVPSGGVRQGAVFLDSVDLALRLDLGRLARWRGASLFVHGLGVNGTDPNRYVGSAQGVSAIGAPPFWALYEVCLEKTLPRASLSLLGGLYDLNSEFDVLESSLLFLNPSHGIDPTFSTSGANGPSIFPTTTIGVRGQWVPSGHFYLQSALMNGAAGAPGPPGGLGLPDVGSHGVLSTTEGGYEFRIPTARESGRMRHTRRERLRRAEYRGKVALGAWFYTAGLQPLATEPAGPSFPIRGNRGLYLLAERSFTPRLAAFTRLGIAADRRNRLQYYAGAGVVCRGPAGRSGDEAGLSLAAAFDGTGYVHPAGVEGVSRAEWNIEATYRLRLSSWLHLQPDAQCVVHPAQNPAVGTALALGLHVEVRI
jgi:porin